MAQVEIFFHFTGEEIKRQINGLTNSEPIPPAKKIRRSKNEPAFGLQHCLYSLPELT